MVLQAEQSYVNALIFTTITEACTVIIFGLLAFEMFHPYIAFFLTLLVGLIIVILWTLYKINLMDRDLKKQIRIIRDSTAINVPCPDYYVRTSNNDRDIVCENGYITPDKRFKYKFYDEEADNNENIDEINLTTTFEGEPLQEVCENEFEENGKFRNIPWTAVRPSCQNLSDYVEKYNVNDTDSDTNSTTSE